MPRSGSWWLSEFTGEKIRIECECGISRIYDSKTMLERIGERSMPGLLTELALANGCKRTTNKFYDRCKLNYGKHHACQGGIALSIEPADGAAAPAGSPEEITFANLPWYELFCECRACGRESRLDRCALVKKFGAKQPILPLARKLRCSKCRNKDGNVIKVGKVTR